MKKILNFSGGLTSGLMLRRELDKNPNFRDEFTICFCNTGKERDETLDFVHEVETRWQVPIVWLEYKRFPASTIPSEVFPTEQRQKNHLAIGDGLTHWFRIVNYETASRKGQPFDDLLSWAEPLPNVVGRYCSTQLKIRSIMRYAFSMGWKEFSPHIGIRKDESHRKLQILQSCETFIHPVFPLIDDNITVKDVNEFWSKQPFTLQLKNYEGNCDLCFLKSDWKRRRIMRDNPARANWWIEKEADAQAHAKSGATFRYGETYAGVLSDALHPEFDFDSANDNDIPCSCAEKGFEKES